MHCGNSFQFVFKFVLLISQFEEIVGAPLFYQTNSSQRSVRFQDTCTEVIVKSGENIILPCVVENIGENMVSWIRQKDLQILTSDIRRFTGDDRFRIDQVDENRTIWNLGIQNVKPTDAGFYECQVNTEPKSKRSVLLFVVPGNEGSDIIYDEEESSNMISEKQPTQIATILGSSEQYVRIGTTVNLFCKITTNQSEDPTTDDNPYSKYRKKVKWFHNSRLLSFQAARGGLNIDTERNSHMILSRLTIPQITVEDSGVYTCQPIKGQPQNVTIDVIQDEETEAVRPENYSQPNRAIPLRSEITLALLVLFIHLRR